jgi:integrase
VTIKRWTYIAEDFLKFLERKNLSFGKADTQSVRDYLAYKKRDVSGNGMRVIYYALKSFYKIWGKKWDLEKRDVPHAREPERPFFNVDETRQMLEAGKNRWKGRGDFIGLRDFVMLLVSVETGSRRIQLQRLNLENFTKEKTLNIPPAFKGGSWTNRKLRDETVLHIDEYLVARKQYLGESSDEPTSPLFLDKTRKRISPESMGWSFSEIKKLAGVEKPGAQYHGLRRSKVTRLHKGGMDEMTICEVLGWKKGSKEPSIYCRLDQSEIQQKAMKADELMMEDEQ